MKVVLTGSSGRIGRAIFGALAGAHEVVGIDRTVFSTTHIVGDCTDRALLESALEGAYAVIHTAGPHAPHVGIVPDAEFERVNVEGTRTLIEVARTSGVRRIVYTSTTALYGHAIEPGKCSWIDEATEPLPRTIYHRTKLAAEALLADAADEALGVRVLRMSRCFPEAAPLMALYRLHRGIDARDVGEAHALALAHEGAAFERFVISGATPFVSGDCDELAHDAPAVIRARSPQLAAAFNERGWKLPKTIDRVYSSARAQGELDWKPTRDWREVIAQLDSGDIEVLAANVRETPVHE